jgi:hypothetical protein
MNIRLKIKRALLCILLAGSITSVFSQNTSLNELHKELPYTKGGLVKITNNKWNLNIRTWNKDKVKFSIQVDGNADSLNKTDWASAIGVNFLSTGKDIDIKVLNLPNRKENLNVQQATKDVIGDGTGSTQPTVLNSGLGVNKLSPVPQQRAFQMGLVPANAAMSPEVITIYIPENTPLEINNTHTSVLITNDIGTAVFKLNNANVIATGNIAKLKVTASLSNLSFEDVQDAELDLSNGCSFRAKNVKVMDIESKSSRIEYEKGGSLYIRSTIDDYTIDEIDKVDGRKTYGSMRIGQLNNTLQLEGANADIKIRTISPTVELVRINNLFANLRLPLKSLTNYTVKFDGIYSSVFAPFEMIPTIPDEKTKQASNAEQMKNASSGTGTLLSIMGQVPNQFGQKPNVPSGFTASSGNITGKQTKIEIVCPQCLVDFK